MSTFDLLPENSYSRKAVVGFSLLSIALLALGAVEIKHGNGLEGWSNVSLGIGMLIVGGTRKREVPTNECGRLPSGTEIPPGK
jgi:hypothetical protein